MDVLREYLAELARLVNEMSPYLLLGFFFAGVLRVVFPRRVIRQYMGGSDFRSAFNASLLGVPMPLCSCGVLPTGIGFYRNGASRGSTVSFLISTPQTGVDSILATYAMLGLPLALIRPVAALVTGVLGGLLGNLAVPGQRAEKERDAGSMEEVPRTARELFRYGFVELLQDISKWLLIGLLAAALISVLIPADFFTEGISSEVMAMLIMLAASVPLYVCATGSIPIAAVLLMKGISPGAALVLLMAGPATNFATMAVIGNVMGRRTLWIYLTSIIGGALLFGFLVNELIPRQWILGAVPGGMAPSAHGHTGGWFQWVCSGMLVLLMLNGYLLKLRQRKKAKEYQAGETTGKAPTEHHFRVEGMTCSHCKASVEKGLGSIEGISMAYADPDRDLVTLQAERLSDEQVRETVEGLGYTFKGRQYRL